jgi:predicted phage terminase large subunit-like protein
MELTAQVVEGFISSTLVKDYDEPTPLEDFHREWLEMCCDKQRFVALSAPRGHSKSSTITFGYLLAELLFRKSRYALIVSDTFSQSTLFLGDLAKALSTNDEIHGLFGRIDFLKMTEDDIICSMEDGHTFRVQAKGAEQKIRGLKWLSRRPDLIIIDDLENEEIVLNKERREKLRRWFFGALIPSLSLNGKVRYVGTILHLDSLLERLMPQALLQAKGSKYLRHLKKEELRESSEIKLNWLSAKYRAHNEDFSKILWPSRWSAADFKQKQAEYASQGLSDSYSQEYLNVPLDESDTFFKRQDFLPLKDADRKKNLNFYIAADLAISKKEKSDYSVFAVAGMDEDGRLQCVNIIRDRMDSMEIVDTVLALQKTYKPLLFGIEQGVIEKSIGPYLNQAMMQTGVFVNLVRIRPSSDKITRARSMNARMRAGAVKFDKEADWYQQFEDELLRFPRDRHDDQVDAWSYIGLMLDTMIAADTQQEVEEEEYRESLHDAGLDQQGRNTITGY